MNLAMKTEMNLVQVLFKKGVLFDLDIGRWQAIARMDEQDLLLKKVNRSAMYLGHKKLLPPWASEKMVNLEGKMRGYLELHSAPFPIAGAVFVQYKTLPQVLKRLNELKAEFGAAADDLVANYESYKNYQLQTLDREAENIASQHYRGLEEKSKEKQGWTDELSKDYEELMAWLNNQKVRNRELYPGKEALRSRYYVSWRMFKVDPVGAAEMDEVGTEEVIAAQKQLQADLEAWVKEQAKEMHLALGKAAARAKELLEKQGKLHPKNLKPLFDAFELFGSVDIAGSSFQTQVGELKKQFLAFQSGSTGVPDYELSAAAVNNGKEDFAGLLDTVAKLAVEETAQKAGLDAVTGSEFKRVLEL